MTNETVEGAIFGFAFGDAWGKDPEFKPHRELIRTRPEFPAEALITDDTQMSLYTIYAIMYELEENPYLLKSLHLNEEDRNTVRTLFADSYVEWLHDPNNDRAPGQTCLKAITVYEQLTKTLGFLSLKEKPTGLEGCHWESKGCGANMRVGWLGLLPLNEEDIINLSIIQSETTHGHPLALSASVLTALTVKAIFDGEIKSGNNTYLTWALNKVTALADELDFKGSDAPGSWSVKYREGLTLVQQFLESKEGVVQDFINSDADENVCSFFGEGWIAEEAYLVALMVADVVPEPVEALRRLVYTSGDSDSIAAIGGMFIGAEKGRQAFPDTWVSHLEPAYLEELEEVTQFIQRINQNKPAAI